MSDISIKIVETKKEFQAAFRIRHDAYVQMKYISPQPNGMRVLPYDFLDENTVFLALHKDEPIGTISVTLDSVVGLPTSQDFPEVIEDLRKKYKKVSEGHSVMVHPNHQGKHGRLAQALERAAFRQAYLQGSDYMVIGAIPGDVEVFNRFMGFEQISEIRTYESLNRIDACVIGLDLERFKTQTQFEFQSYLLKEYADNIAKEELRRPVID